MLKNFSDPKFKKKLNTGLILIVMLEFIGIAFAPNRAATSPKETRITFASSSVKKTSKTKSAHRKKSVTKKPATRQASIKIPKFQYFLIREKQSELDEGLRTARKAGAAHLAQLLKKDYDVWLKNELGHKLYAEYQRSPQMMPVD